MPKKKNSVHFPPVSEDVRIAVDVAIKKFMFSEQSGRLINSL